MISSQICTEIKILLEDKIKIKSVEHVSDDTFNIVSAYNYDIVNTLPSVFANEYFGMSGVSQVIEVLSCITGEDDKIITEDVNRYTQQNGINITIPLFLRVIAK